MKRQTFQPDLNDFAGGPLVRIEIAAKECDTVERLGAIETKLFAEGSLIETKVT
jgi:hypothetical protein